MTPEQATELLRIAHNLEATALFVLIVCAIIIGCAVGYALELIAKAMNRGRR